MKKKKKFKGKDLVVMVTQIQGLSGWNFYKISLNPWSK